MRTKVLVLLACFFLLATCLCACQDRVHHNDTNEIDPSVWKSAYLQIVESKKDINKKFALIYIDADNIPELYILGSSEAEGDMIYSYKNGEIVELHLARMFGGKYVERSGKIINQSGHMGNYIEYVYVLDDHGFTRILNASYTERIEEQENGEHTVIREYFIDGETVSEADYHNAVNSSFDISMSDELYTKSVSYDDIKKQLS